MTAICPRDRVKSLVLVAPVIDSHRVLDSFILSIFFLSFIPKLVMCRCYVLRYSFFKTYYLWGQVTYVLVVFTFIKLSYWPR